MAAVVGGGGGEEPAWRHPCLGDDKPLMPQRDRSLL